MAFVREKVTKKRTYYYIVANYRVNGKVIQNILYAGVTRPWKRGSVEEKEWLESFQEGRSGIIKLTFPPEGKIWKRLIEEDEEDVGKPGFWLIEGWKDIQEREDKLKLKRASKQRCAND
ncbi:unnamed protein product [marine sediment metagenome]|uniref:Uncharacterized protein n=1 Tax=marine sediment metagenome TaxID=412755 RepID=X1KW89_9ZZZZ